MISDKKASKTFINNIPKAELHVHLEGTIEPEMMFQIAERNNVRLKYKTVEALKKAYDFDDLRDFLTIYNEGTKILRTSMDFYDITMAYLSKCYEQNVLHTEIFIDFQTYSKRNIAPTVLMEGIEAARIDAMSRWNISTELILCFLRHLGPEAARQTYEQVLTFRDKIIGIGLASTENGYPPELFTEIFTDARKAGFRTVAHAGEEGPWEYVQNSIEYLKIDRIDHGNRSCDNPELVKQIIDLKLPLTLCPLSNIKLKNVDRIENHTVKKMLDRGMLITINSDDPAYFGGYVNENMLLVANTFDLTEGDIYTLAKNSIEASFAGEERKRFLFGALKNYA
jgi:adenosine deaminase